jgi:methylmalonyl-CoA mutase C-terminal domain/subunit
MQRKIRVLVGKPGLDGHDRGAKVVAAALRDAGMEVIYTGLHQTPEQVVEAAVQEDVDVVALSVLSGAHMTLFPEILELMRARGIGDRLLTGGGIIPSDDMHTLLVQGVGKLFGPGTNTHDIVSYIREWYAGVHGVGALPPLPPPPARSEPMTGTSTRPVSAPARDAHHARAAAKPAARAAKRPSAAKRAAKPTKTRAATSQATARRKAAPAKRSVAKKPARKRGARKQGARR